MLPVVGAEPKDGGSFAGSIEMSMLGAVQRRVGEAFGGQHLADQDQRGAAEIPGGDLGQDVAEGAANLFLVGPTGPVDHRDRAVGAVVRQQFLDDLRQVGDAQVDRQGRPVPRQVAQALAFGIFVRAA